ncbi:MAG: hypothetical protein R2762_04945 [Bryobacteraceae bacterium]
MEEVVQRRVKPKTIVHYEGMVKHLKEGPLASVQIAKLTRPRVQAFLNEKLDSGLEPKTVKHIRDTLRAALNVAMDEWELIQRTLRRRRRRVESRSPRSAFSPSTKPSAS